MKFLNRFIKIYRGYVKNIAHPEGCIAERYIVKETILYCMEYMPYGDRGGRKRMRQRFLDDDGGCDEETLDKGKIINLTNVQHKHVRRCILDNYGGIVDWKELVNKVSKRTCKVL